MSRAALVSTVVGLALVAVVIVVVAGGVAWIERRGDPTFPHERAPTRPDDAPAPLAPGLASRAPERTPAPAGVGATDGPVRVRCRVRGLGSRPRRIELDLAPDGRTAPADLLRLRFEDEGDERGVPDAARYAVVSARLDGWTSDQHFPDVLADAERGVVVDVWAPTAAALAVVDASTGATVPAARAVAAATYADAWGEAPFPSATTLAWRAIPADAGGRIALPASAAPRAWWVAAPGRAWTRVVVRPDARPADVALPPGGTLHVDVVPWANLPAPMVVLARPDAPRFHAVELRAADEPGRFAIDGLPPGRWQVRVGRRSELWVEEPVWAEQDVDVVAGDTRSVRLVVEPPSRNGRHDLVGIVVVPPAWGVRPTRIELSGEGAGRHFTHRGVELGVGPNTNGLHRTVALAAGESGPTFSFREPDLPASVYLLTVLPYRWQRYVWLPGPADGLRLEVAPPVELRVRVLDDATGAPVLSAAVSATVHADEPSPPDDGIPRDDPCGWSGKPLPADRRAGSTDFVVRLPAAQVGLAVEAPGYEDVRRDLTLTADRDPWVEDVRLRGAGTIVVRIVRDGAVLETATGRASFTLGDDVSLRSSGFWTIREGVARLLKVPAGRCVVRWDLWERHPAGETRTQLVEVRAGSTTTVDFEADGP